MRKEPMTRPAMNRYPLLIARRRVRVVVRLACLVLLLSLAVATSAGTAEGVTACEARDYQLPPGNCGLQQGVDHSLDQ